MLIKSLLWIFFCILVLIIPSLVISYMQKLKRKETEIKTVLWGKLTAKYLDAYYPRSFEEKGKIPENEESASNKLDKIIKTFFETEYNIGKFMIPLAGLVTISGIGFFSFISLNYPLIKISAAESAFLKDIPVLIYFGFFGAFIAGFVETYKRYNNMDLTPSFLYMLNSKILLCSVLGYLWSFTFTPELAIFISFGMGFFPLSSLQKLIKSLTSKKLNKEEIAGQSSDFNNLQGLNESIIERLEEENIFSCQNLAYCDPVKLLLRTNFQLKIMLDWIDQALLYIYVGDKIEKLRVAGIRGAVEFASIYEWNPQKREVLIKSLAGEIGISIEELENFIENLYTDPHIDFIWDLFSEYAPEGKNGASQPKGSLITSKQTSGS